MSSKRLLTIFGATGNQGGSVISTILSTPSLASKYTLRGITRSVTSDKAKSLTSQGVEMVSADIDDPTTLAPALQDSYGVFGITDFWAHMSKDREIQQGKNIFHAAKEVGVKHFVWSSLPYAEKISGGMLKHVSHFDSKAIVEEYVEGGKGEMWVSYFMPAMFVGFLENAVKEVGGALTIGMPFDGEAAWPLIDPGHDSGKYVAGMFEKGKEADGKRVHAVGGWTTGNEIAKLVGKKVGREVVFKTIPADVFASFLPPPVKNELLETMLLIGGYSYFGTGADKEQAEYDQYIAKGTGDKLDVAGWVESNGKWKF